MDLHATVCVCDNLRTICGGQFAPSTMEVLGIRLSGSAASAFTHETILPALSHFKSFVNLILLLVCNFTCLSRRRHLFTVYMWKSRDS